MRKLGHGLFAGARSLRGRRARAGDKGGGKCRSHEQSGMRQRFGCKDIVDEEAPPVVPRRLRRDPKHFADDTDSAVLLHSQSRVASLESDMTVEEKKKRIRDALDEYWERKKAEHGEHFDEEEVMRAFARKQLLNAESNSDLLMTSEIVIEEDWLGGVEALPGNIYRLAVFGSIFVKLQGESWAHNAQAVAKMIGIFVIIMIQIIGPPAIFMSRMFGDGVLNEAMYSWSCCPWHPAFDPTSSATCHYENTPVSKVTYFDDWAHIKVTKLLGMLMMLAFILNGLFVVLDEKASWKSIYNTFRYLDVMNDKFRISGMSFLYFDTLINIWVITWCCIDVFLVVGASPSPSSVLMDALGLVFLYNLDDIGGDLGFVNEDDWPGRRLAWIYNEIVIPDERFDAEKLDVVGVGMASFYNLAITSLVIMSIGLPTLAAFTPFTQILAYY
eukprot:TRINITY_DN24628_c0_g1_i2.p1 TRINITY_DN24628_c0_g1~~TRINITY_DN24628_c0_g1_i2.p1  ORF type:complete len:442 (-),score=73.56 TRINITY_DN24628_c0_g1_i2:275-1600(-)